MQKRFFILSALMAACACSADNADEVEPRLVVEAWIESDGAPVVMVTTSVTPTREPQAISSLSNHVERWAKVSISDGEGEIILTGYITSRYFPPYYYTTGRMTGEVGKTYRLTVETKGRRATAYATIPPPQDLIRLEPVPFGDDGDQFLIKATVSGNGHYKFFTRIEGRDESYIPSITSLADAGKTGTEITIRPGSTLNHLDNRPSFKSGETVSVKVCTMEDDIYQMWKTLDNLIYLDRTAFFTLDTNLPGNVDGAIGYFAGYGKREYQITLP